MLSFEMFKIQQDNCQLFLDSNRNTDWIKDLNRLMYNMYCKIYLKAFS